MSGNVKLNCPAGGSVTISAADTASNLTATIPAATDTLVNLASTQTLTNKTLTAAGSNTVEATSGPTSTQLAGQRNKIINGAMMIDQRNAGAAVTVPTSGLVFPCDRFFVNRANGYLNTATAQQVTVAPAGYKNSLKYTSGTAETLSGNMYSNIQQYIEGNNVADLGWGATGAAAVTLSFWVNISTTGTFGGVVRSADATLSYPFSFSYPSANVWQYVTINISGPTSGGTTAFPNGNGAAFAIFWDLGVGPGLSGSATGAWQSANYLGLTGGVKLNALTGATFYITGVQLEKGATATPFENRLYGTELALCQRYCVIVNGTNNYRIAGQFYNTTAGRVILPHYVTMRSAPTLTVSGLTGQAIGNGTTTFTGNNANQILGADASSWDLTGATVVRLAFQQLTYDGTATLSAEL